jgi:hypothetical protein
LAASSRDFVEESTELPATRLVHQLEIRFPSDFRVHPSNFKAEGGACRRQAVPIARRSNTSLNSKGRTTSAQALAPIAAFIFVMRMSERLQIAPQPFVCSRLFARNVTSAGPRQNRRPRRRVPRRCRRSDHCRSSRHHSSHGVQCSAHAGHNCSCRRSPAE